MSITVAQLAKLSDYYGFDLDEAREYIGLGPAKRRGRPASDSSPPKPKAEKPKPKAEKPKTEKRSGTTGYLLFMKENKDRIAEQIRNETRPGEKSQNLLSAVANNWKMLPDDVRSAYNRKALRV